MSLKSQKFILSSINIKEIHEKYSIEFITALPDYDTKEDDIQNTSDIKSLDYDKQSFKPVEDSKTSISYINITKPSSDANILEYNCFWCRHPCGHKDPIGCPIKYESNKKLSTYKSCINNQVYNMVEETHNVYNGEDTKHIYTVDGVFCSFNCCVSYINDNKHRDNMYDLSYTLLLQMYNHITGKCIKSISPAPHWRLIDRYGGHLNIIQFNKELDTVEYKLSGIIRHGVYFNPISFIYDRKINI